MENKVVAIIQARMGSKRFPQKMAAYLGDYPIIDWVIRRSRQSGLIDKLVLATSAKVENKYLVERAKKYLIGYYCGSENDVLSRFVEIANKEHADIIVRICADNPFISALEVDRIVNLFLDKKLDYAFNHIPAMGNNYVDGVGAEIFSLDILHDIHNHAKSAEHKEHVTKYIWDNIKNYKIGSLPAPYGLNYPDIRLDVDTEKDLSKLENYLILFEPWDRPENVNIQKLLISLSENI